ncbi:hypothetical protein HDV03_000868 [Kappamyces sp. JEL0829]|nr:hypothetical protein HDV03_000868 [Kappamyces sp. JEL0829]
MEHVYFTLEALLVRAKAMTELFANPELMYTYIGLANRLVREFEIAHPSTFSFQLPNTPSPQSLSIWPFKVPEKEFRFPLSIMERARRIYIVASLFVYDTALKDLNGSLFNFEDHELPATQFGNFVCPWENPYLGLDIKNILQTSVFGVGVEGDIKKDWVYALEVDPLTDALRWAKLANLCRRVVNFKRKSFYMCSDPLSSDLKEQLAIHELFLAELSLYDGYTSLQQKIYIYSNLVVLHLPSFSSSEINFRLNFNSHETVTSRTVMFTSVQSLAACISTTKASASIALLNAGRVAVFATVAVKTAIQAYKHQMSTGNGLDYALKTELNVLKRCGRSMVEEYRKLSVWMAAVLYIVLLKMDAAIEL